MFIFLAALAVRLWGLVHLSDSPYLLPEHGDMRFYYDWALRILGGEWGDGKAFYGLPGFAFLLAGLFFLVGPDPFVVGMLHAMLDGFVAVLLYWIAILSFSKPANPIPAPEGGNPPSPDPRWIGLVAAGAWILFVPGQAFSLVLMPTSWAVAIFWGVVWWVLRLRARGLGSGWELAALGLVIGLGATLVATLLFLVPLVCAVVLRTMKKGRAKPLLAGACFFAGVLAGTAPCWSYNFLVAGERVFLSAHGGLNLYVGNHPGADGYPAIPSGLRADQAGMLRDSIAIAERESGRELTRAEVSRYWAGLARQHIADDPGRWVRLMVRKIGNFWNRHLYDDLAVVVPFAERGIVLPGLYFGLLSLLGVPGMVLAAGRFPASRWVAAAVLLLMAALLPVFITERYRLVAVPGLALFAAFGVSFAIVALRARAWRMPCLFAVGVALWAPVVFAPRDATRADAHHLYNSGIVYLAEGAFADAGEKLRAAERLVPDNAELQFALGNLWLEQGQFDAAKPHYRRVLELNPEHAGTFNNLGFIALGEGRAELAVEFFERALAGQPDNAKTHYLLARARLAAGDRAGAGRALGRALELRPEQPEFLQLQRQIGE